MGDVLCRLALVLAAGVLCLVAVLAVRFGGRLLEMVWREATGEFERYESDEANRAPR